MKIIFEYVNSFCFSRHLIFKFRDFAFYCSSLMYSKMLLSRVCDLYCVDRMGCVFLYRMTVRLAQTDVSFNQQMMHEHTDAETQLQEEISSVWNYTGLVKRCSDQAEIKR